MSASAETNCCELCGRAIDALQFHHLIPRTVHSNKWFRARYDRLQMRQGLMLCEDCHAAVHRYVSSAKELGRKYQTKDALLAHPEIGKYVKWVATRRPGARVRTRHARGGVG